MNSGTIPQRQTIRAPQPPFKLLLGIALAIIFMMFFAWTARSFSKLEPVPLVPCKRCAEKCPCPRMSGAIRCGCPE